MNPPADFAEEVKRSLSFPNPKYLEAQRMGRWTGNIPHYLVAYESTPNGLLIPRGFGPRLLAMANYNDLEIVFQDRTRTLRKVNFHFKGTLRPFQEEALQDILSRPMGTLAAPTGSGKTVIALAAIAERRQPALVVVHTKELLHQWVDRIGAFLGIPAKEVGVIGAGKRTVGRGITVAIVNTLYKCADQVAPRIGHLIVDECHRTPSRTFTEAVTAFDARYFLGLSATPWRRDRLGKLIYWHLGDRVHSVEPGILQRSGDILRAEVIWRETDFRTRFDPSEEYSRMLSELTRDQARNELIAQDVVQAAAEDGQGIVLVLTDRKEHVAALSGLLEARGVATACLTGEMNTKTRAETLESLRGGKSRVLVATGQLIGEGFDLPAMNTLFLVTPIRFDGRVLQYLGRVLRPAPSKDRAKVYDYIDVNVGPLRASAKARRRVYERHGMESRDGS